MSALIKTLPIADAAFLVNCVSDTTGTYFFNPESLPHAYGFDGSGNLVTDTVTDGALSFKKTFTYVNSRISAESGWALVA